jgi:hypothetical protein
MRRSSEEGTGKRVSRKWTAEEVQQLQSAIKQAKAPVETLNWAGIATSVPGRTGKQCREKYKVRRGDDARTVALGLERSFGAEGQRSTGL